MTSNDHKPPRTGTKAAFSAAWKTFSVPCSQHYPALGRKIVLPFTAIQVGEDLISTANFSPVFHQCLLDDSST